MTTPALEVYLVVSEEYYGEHIRGVFSTLAKAKEFASAKSEFISLEFKIIKTQIDFPDTDEEIDENVPEAEPVPYGDEVTSDYDDDGGCDCGGCVSEKAWK